MCGTCGCREHHHHDHLHDHEYWHGHEHHYRHHGEGKVITLEQDILQRNNLLAERNRGYFEAKHIFLSESDEFSRFRQNDIIGRNDTPVEF